MLRSIYTEIKQILRNLLRNVKATFLKVLGIVLIVILEKSVELLLGLLFKR